MPATGTLLISGPAEAASQIVLAHGAGAAMDSPLMNYFAEGLGSNGIQVVRFEFPYMASRRQTGKRRPPDRQEILIETWLDVIQQLGPQRRWIGGKSLGGRIASLVADEAAVAGLVCLGYPFHPAGKPTQLRVEPLRELKTPTLILQGERDPFGNRQEVATYGLPRSIELHWLADGDHSLKPRKSRGRTAEQNWDEGIQRIVGFLDLRQEESS